MKKRVFVDAHVFDGEFQGTWTYIKEIYSILIIKRPDIIFYLAANDIENLQKIFGKAPNVKYIKYKFKSSTLRLGFELPFILLYNKIDLAHFQYITPFIKVCKFMITTHDVLFYDFRSEFSKFYILQKSFFYKISAKLSNYILTVSNYSKNRIEHYFPFTSGKIIITPNAVNQDVFYLSDKEISRDFIKSKYGISKYILYVSRIEPRKKHDLLLKSFIDLKLFKENYSLVFIGKESIKNEILDNILVDNPNLKNYFYFESIEQKDLREFINGAELFVYPSLAEGFGIPPLEAAIMKTPVLCSSKTAMSDFYFFNENLFDPDKINEFQDKLINRLKNNNIDDLNDIYKQIKTFYSWDESAENINKILNTI
ncbi:Glycosyltransferase involved in cell wall bisynthesis [Flavobacterium resistens]|uniref:Glycosyltransferase n=1 Tax=Flavobacterium resistens TaxID=443612 RepID=A0A521DTL6_9FLAO|nr:glycosyltransferase family 1 protein [Flavobacterium resistens]MRX68172.1 glycosyltransferase [Flavobacterium resistens]SMO75069.1 Glycosyltransferase involved in cell wall bisynthesis [Flavobacterium resistens]